MEDVPGNPAVGVFHVITFSLHMAPRCVDVHERDSYSNWIFYWHVELISMCAAAVQQYVCHGFQLLFRFLGYTFLVCKHMLFVAYKFLESKLGGGLYIVRFRLRDAHETS